MDLKMCVMTLRYCHIFKYIQSQLSDRVNYLTYLFIQFPWGFVRKTTQKLDVIGTYWGKKLCIEHIQSPYFVFYVRYIFYTLI